MPCSRPSRCSASTLYIRANKLAKCTVLRSKAQMPRWRGRKPQWREREMLQARETVDLRGSGLPKPSCGAFSQRRAVVSDRAVEHQCHWARQTGPRRRRSSSSSKTAEEAERHCSSGDARLGAWQSLACDSPKTRQDKIDTHEQAPRKWMGPDG